MKRLISCFSLMILISGTFGCSMCCGPYDFDYPTFGGKHERVDRAYGRVGSIFSDPNAMGYGESADSNLKPRPEMRSPDTGLDDDLDIDGIESITPRPAPDDQQPGVLPNPDDTDPTASRLSKPRPLRSRFQWR